MEALFFIEVLVKKVMVYKIVKPAVTKDDIEFTLKFDKVFKFQIPAESNSTDDVEGDENYHMTFDCGQSFLFPSQVSKLLRKMENCNLSITLNRVITKNGKANNKSRILKIIGSTTWKFPKSFSKLIKRSKKDKKLIPVTGDETFRFKSKSKENIALAEMYIRFTCFGKNILTIFSCMPPLHGKENLPRKFIFKNAGATSIFQIERFGDKSTAEAMGLPIAPVLFANELEGFSWKPLFFNPRKAKASVMVSTFNIFKQEEEDDDEEDEMNPDIIGEKICGSKYCPAAVKFRDLGIGPLAIGRCLGVPTPKDKPNVIYRMSNTYGTMDSYGPYGLLDRRPSHEAKINVIKKDICKEICGSNAKITGIHENSCPNYSPGQSIFSSVTHNYPRSFFGQYDNPFPTSCCGPNVQKSTCCRLRAGADNCELDNCPNKPPKINCEGIACPVSRVQLAPMECIPNFQAKLRQLSLMVNSLDVCGGVPCLFGPLASTRLNAIRETGQGCSQQSQPCQSRANSQKTYPSFDRGMSYSSTQMSQFYEKHNQQRSETTTKSLYHFPMDFSDQRKPSSLSQKCVKYESNVYTSHPCPLVDPCQKPNKSCYQRNSNDNDYDDCFYENVHHENSCRRPNCHFSDLSKKKHDECPYSDYDAEEDRLICESSECPFARLKKQKNMCGSPECPYSDYDVEEDRLVCGSSECPFSRLMKSKNITCGNTICPYSDYDAEEEQLICENYTCPFSRFSHQQNECLENDLYLESICGSPDCPYSKGYTKHLKKKIESTCSIPECPYHKDVCQRPECPYYEEECKNPECPYSKNICEIPECPHQKNICENSECPYYKDVCENRDCPYSKHICHLPECPYSKKDVSSDPRTPCNSPKPPCKCGCYEIRTLYKPYEKLMGSSYYKNPALMNDSMLFKDNILDGFAMPPFKPQNRDNSMNNYLAIESSDFFTENVTTTPKIEKVEKPDKPAEETESKRKGPCTRATCHFKKYKTCAECGGITKTGATCDNPDVPYKDVSYEEIKMGGDMMSYRRRRQSARSNKRSQSHKAADAILEALNQKKLAKVNIGFQEKKKYHRKSRFAYNVGEYYPGIRIGHKQCAVTGKNVPAYMGWLWNTDPVGRLKKRRGWRPGVLGKTIHERIVSRRRALGIPSPPELKMLVAKKKVKKNTDQEEEESDNEIEPKPTLIIKKKKGCYWITVNPLKDPRTLMPSENPYMECTPMQFCIVKTKPQQIFEDTESESEYSGELGSSENFYKDCMCDEDMKLMEVESSSSDGSLEIEFTTPAGLIIPEDMKKPPNVVHTETQFNESDLTDPDCVLLTPKVMTRKKKVRMKGVFV